ncbi:ABC-type Co2+ transport system, periplasmic component [Desulfocurvibacter africanus PCS]|uniref:ABC-type Co2+ transport system, periplasmic component n=1 Tax=Desulfocurvibacter africanus PCS TaxID=1262666 RepID=M5PY00_DESAF|nr:DUF4198 domain-containing protein [Desulfocurvibacter africanus]EMG38919.1 ABC-type Co2+ transport system, periplasmic component [Desulfocurvibacter africanus PCS]
MKRLISSGTISLLLIFLSTLSAQAHFGMLIPSQSTVMPPARAVTIELSFSHPFEGQGMELAKPKAFGIMLDGKTVDLLGSLKPAKIMGHTAWSSQYVFSRPGLAAFYMEPQPYWEPAEDCFIIHYTKIIVAAFGEEEGWDQPVGLKTEIVPLTRPFGNYVGNVFQGQVLLDGKPVPQAMVEVEYYNRDGKYEAPNDYMITQVIKADQNGVFTYVCPLAGWWGFAALNEADFTIKQQGQDKGVELGAVLWTQMHDIRKK